MVFKSKESITCSNCSCNNMLTTSCGSIFRLMAGSLQGSMLQHTCTVSDFQLHFQANSRIALMRNSGRKQDVIPALLCWGPSPNRRMTLVVGHCESQSVTDPARYRSCRLRRLLGAGRGRNFAPYPSADSATTVCACMPRIHWASVGKG